MAKPLKFSAYFNTEASCRVDIEVNDEMIAQIAAAYDIDPETVDDDVIIQFLRDGEAYQELPSLCAQCGGWGGQHSMDIGEWELDKDGEYHKAIERVED